MSCKCYSHKKNVCFIKLSDAQIKSEDQFLNEGYTFVRYDDKHEEVVLTKRV